MILIFITLKTTAAKSSSNTRDIHFLHAFIVYQLLSKRIERDLAFVSSLVASSKEKQKRSGNDTPDTSTGPQKIDARINPAVVKLLDTTIQSLTHMRSLSIVDESPDLANAVEVRIAFTKSRR